MVVSVDFEIIYQVCSAISAVFSFGVVATGLVFPHLMLRSSRPFSQIIFCISLSDFLGSFGNSFGFPNNGTPSCTIQAILLNCFMPASWLWTTMLVFQLRCMMKQRQLWLSMKYLHAFCWLTSFVLILLPLSTNTYGIDDSTQGQSPCYFAGNYVEQYYWGLFAFFVVYFLCFVLMVSWSVEVLFYILHTEIEKNHKVWKIFRTTWLYPLIMIITWLPISVIYCVQNQYNSEWMFQILMISQIVATQYGTLSALVYFFNCTEARTRWHNLVMGSLVSPIMMLVSNEDMTNQAVSSSGASGVHEPEPESSMDEEDCWRGSHSTNKTICLQEDSCGNVIYLSHCRHEDDRLSLSLVEKLVPNSSTSVPNSSNSVPSSSTSRSPSVSSQR